MRELRSNTCLLTRPGVTVLTELRTQGAVERALEDVRATAVAHAARRVLPDEDVRLAVEDLLPQRGLLDLVPIEARHELVEAPLLIQRPCA